MQKLAGLDQKIVELEPGNRICRSSTEKGDWIEFKRGSEFYLEKNAAKTDGVKKGQGANNEKPKE